jgi:hypothetical protein
MTRNAFGLTEYKKEAMECQGKRRGYSLDNIAMIVYKYADRFGADLNQRDGEEPSNDHQHQKANRP